MKNRFQTKQRRARAGAWIPLAAMVAVVALFLYGLGNVSSVSEGEQLRAVERAVTRAAVQCYALEGRYPARLDYLEERYALLLDHERYIIQYDIFASNIMPSVLVLPREFREEADDEDWF